MKAPSCWPDWRKPIIAEEIEHLALNFAPLGSPCTDRACSLDDACSAGQEQSSSPNH